MAAYLSVAWASLAAFSRSRSVMAAATSDPPATASDPPSQKSFWTSTMIRARRSAIRALFSGEPLGVFSVETGRERRFAARETQPLPGEADQAGRQVGAT